MLTLSLRDTWALETLAAAFYSEFWNNFHIIFYLASNAL